MKINKQDKKGNKVTIEIEAEYSELNPHTESAYKEAAREIKIPGFRKGKVPPDILKTYITEESVLDKAIQKLIAEIYPKVIEETKIEPVDYPDIEILKIEKDKFLTFNIKVEVYPEVKVGNLKSVKVTRPNSDVTDKEIDSTIDSIRNNLATVINVTDRGIQEKDTVVIDIEAKSEEKSVPQLNQKNAKLNVGMAQISFEFDEALIGMSIGESKQFKIKMPKEFFITELHGKDIEFSVTVSEISEKNLPPLDDVFARTVSKSNTLDEMRKEIKTHMEEDKKKYIEQLVRDLALEKAAEVVSVDLPKSMIDREAGIMVDEFDKRLRRNGSNVETYLKSIKKDVESLRGEMKNSAEKRVKAKLLLRNIIEEQKFAASKEELDKEIEEMAKASKKSVDDVKKNVGENGMIAVEDYILHRKAVDHLVSKVKIEQE